MAVRVAFSYSRIKKRVRWENSRRLIAGTLVALTPEQDMFQSKCVIAVVAARPLALVQQSPPEIDLYFAKPEEMQLDPHIEWVMVEERATYFEAARHSLRALQKMMREP